MGNVAVSGAKLSDATPQCPRFALENGRGCPLRRAVANFERGDSGSYSLAASFRHSSKESVLRISWSLAVRWASSVISHW